MSNNLALTLEALQQQQATGELLVTHTSQTWQRWHLYLYLGRLCYATGGVHRNRRWRRSLGQAVDRVVVESSEGTDDLPWEILALERAVRVGRLNLPQAKAAIAVSVREVLFTLVGQPNLHTVWRKAVLPDPIAAINVEQSLAEAAQLWEDWRAAGLGNLQDLLWRFSPDLVPYVSDFERLKQANPDQYQGLAQVLDGESSFWDLAQRLKRPLPALTRILLKHVFDGALSVKEVPDLPAPLSGPTRLLALPEPGAKSPAAPEPAPVEVVRSRQPLVACIDDSPWVARALEAILSPAGFDLLDIEDPMRAFALLLAHRPSFIFLDWVMPNTNGYEFCTRLRKLPLFETVPIVILTANVSIIDRVRAKTVGANDVLTKPPEAAKVMRVLAQHLKALPVA